MENRLRIRTLSNEIRNKLLSLIKDNYILLDLPYYTNIGDTLIWKGTEDFLSTLPYRCLYKTSIENYIKPNISKKVIILIQGGGNFGDLWRRHNDFCLRIIDEFPENPIIILPKTVYYKDENLMKNDALAMSRHPYLSICARDLVSYKTLKKFFSNKILLVPDMAFGISRNFLDSFRTSEQKKALFFKRKDIEHCAYRYAEYLTYKGKIEQKEWPSMEKNLFLTRLLHYLKRFFSLTKKVGYLNRLAGKIVDYYAVNIYMPSLLKIGIRFIKSYEYVYTTRLHGAILSILLGKPVTFFDNSYGKNSTFYDTWLKDCKEISFIRKS